MSLDLSAATVGTMLLIKRSPYENGHIERVERITPTGRPVTKSGTFDPSGYLRGSRDSGQRGVTARIATPDDIAGIYRAGLVRKFKAFDWDKLDAAELKAVAAIISKYR